MSCHTQGARATAAAYAAPGRSEDHQHHRLVTVDQVVPVHPEPLDDIGEDADAGMAEMSEKFREKGGEIYLPAAE